ncbi:hypothetical protein ASPZODRAFT_18685 [Penicilliopsis zonata CBS 506.65]|uniref:Uncharacterized protein n=1 Tax=Penicilliopsis zonata CBS 506.65 TaxID=1073090 RepID=A0A1L9SBD9_9EURO|nr:hypothetical protein ASPZODRAFT_18685 [Penicilliopsis zonata CBS 506.65]OJJ44495.1 hypothetical protein ASPZODRAFT_18685 [Penicilliopsis zonata CBS 506.65]
MSTIIDLDALDDPEATQADILRILKQGLTSEADSATAAAKLAESLRGYIFSQSNGSRGFLADLLWDLWMTLLHVVKIVPIDHPRHDVLITTIDKLRCEGGPVAGPDDSKQWADLPEFRICLIYAWADPSDMSEYTPEDVKAWNRLNSFASRLLTDDFKDWIQFAWWEIASGLETAPQDAAEFEWKLWAATEWLIQCGNLLFKDLTSPEELDAEVLATVKPGPLCENVPPMSLQRWEFWQSRLAELSGGKYSVEGSAEDAVLGASSLSRIDQAIAAMRAHASSSIAQGEIS